jgi:hypothetical protein
MEEAAGGQGAAMREPSIPGATSVRSPVLERVDVVLSFIRERCPASVADAIR